MAKELKVYYRRRKREQTQQIYHIPKCFQLPRSPSAAKPRTDFSLLVCSSKDLEAEPNSSKEIVSSVTLGCSDESNDTRRGTIDSHCNRSTEPESKSQETLRNTMDFPVIEVKSFGYEEERGDDVMTVELTRNRSQRMENNEVSATPGSVVWVKTGGQCWWPAEVLGEGSNPMWSGIHRIEGHVLVQCFGKRESAWINPARDLSPFEECFEERSRDQTEEFQNALKQALYRKEHPRSLRELSGSPDGPDRSTQCDQSPEKDHSSSSSRAGTACTGRVRSKRERKRKVPFDEVTCPLYTARKVRRFKIMRSLGLAAPVGSPF